LLGKFKTGWIISLSARLMQGGRDFWQMVKGFFR
jgi:hypothetical protein